MTPLPTIEEELWKALNKARLVSPPSDERVEKSGVNWEGCEYSKCGRTDKGVSAFGQVVGMRVRSNRPKTKSRSSSDSRNTVEEGETKDVGQFELGTLPLEPGQAGSGDRASTPTLSMDQSEESLPFDPIHDEIPYCQVLNRLLPPDIRILAWCPNLPDGFSARFSCKERRYRYFFTQPAFTPTIGDAGLIQTGTSSHEARREGWLDIDAMRVAAKKFEGLHDFRNFCKIDPSKQIENFERRIFHADVERLDPQQGPASYVSRPPFQQYPKSSLHAISPPNFKDTHNAASIPSTPALYAFTLHGSAFLWHQVRHMVAILFLIGQGLEPISLVDALLDIEATPRRPMYEMGDDAPLVLWDCIFPRNGSGSAEDALEWVYVGEGPGKDEKFGFRGVIPELWSLWRGRKMEEVLVGSLLDRVVGLGQDRNGATADGTARAAGLGTDSTAKGSQKVFQGGDAPRLMGDYVPVLRKPKMEPPVVVNERYARKKGLGKTGTEEGVSSRRIRDFGGQSPYSM